MFHTFKSAHESPLSTDASSSAVKRRIGTSRACETCRRKKTRCDGELPCSACSSYGNESTCHYTNSRQRQKLSFESMKETTSTLQKYRRILHKLFPTTHPDLLTDLPKQELLDLIEIHKAVDIVSPVTPTPNDKPPTPNPDADSLGILQPITENRYDGTEHKTKGVRGISDDVNALSLSVIECPSYLGISSVIAVLRAIVWLDPESQALFSRAGDHSGFVSREQSVPADEAELGLAPRAKSSAWDEIPLINAYFTYVHPFIPIIEEQSFRDTYIASKRSDPRWLLLLYTVLAMGGVAASTADSKDHTVYFNKARRYLALEYLGAAHLERVQALAILGGFYLHYVQQPNLANALMGATFRMATTLGLYKDYPDDLRTTTSKDMTYPNEMRRRVWWCLFNLDAWASSTLGRPTMGRMSHAITAKSPEQPIAPSSQLLTLLQDNIRFCKLSTCMEDILAVSPIIPETELVALNASFVEWYETSSARRINFSSKIQESPGVTVTKNVMRWRYLFSRVILHRPYLLWYAIQRMQFDALRPIHQAAIELCRNVTEEMIEDISSTWQAQNPCAMASWNATWLLYQAVMVPLLSLYSDRNNPDLTERCHHQVKIVLATLTENTLWSPTAKRSLEVVSRIYEASKRTSISDDDQAFFPQSEAGFLTDYQAQMLGLSLPQNDQVETSLHNPDANSGNQEVLMDNMFNYLNWSTGWNDYEDFFQMPGAGLESSTMELWNIGALGLDS